MVYTLIDHTKETLHFIYSIHIFILIGPSIHQANKLYSTGPFRTAESLKQNKTTGSLDILFAMRLK